VDVLVPKSKLFIVIQQLYNTEEEIQLVILVSMPCFVLLPVESIFFISAVNDDIFSLEHIKLYSTQTVATHVEIETLKKFVRRRHEHKKKCKVKAGANPTTSSYNASVVHFYNATGSLACFENNISFYFEKRSSLLQRWRCSCKFQSRRIGSSLRSREQICICFAYI
jgi:hypothetical protein